MRVVLEQCLLCFQVDITSELFKDALKRLNETVKKENIAALKKIQEMTLSEDQIVVGIGVHVVKKLTGRAETTVKRSNMKCPCGCKGTLDYTPEMFIGKYWLSGVSEADIKQDTLALDTYIVLH